MQPTWVGPSFCKPPIQLLLTMSLCPAASYGSTKRYKSVQRLVKVNDSTVLGAGGEISDLQFILNMLDDLRTEDYCADDGQSLSSQELYSYLSRVMYNRRNK